MLLLASGPLGYNATQEQITLDTENATVSPDPAPQEAPAAEAQPTVSTEGQPDSGAPDPSQSSQGLIEPYLKDVDPLLRDKVAPVLEKFRKEQDARVNEKIAKETAKRRQYEQYGDIKQIEVATQVLNSFIADPVATTQWLIDRGQAELGVDIMEALTASPDVETPKDAETGEALTPEKIVEILEQREQAKAQEQTRSQLLAQQQQQAIQRAQTWFDEAVNRHGVPADALNDGLKQAMFTRASAIREQGLAADGRTAIDMAVAEIGQAFSRAGAKAPSPQEPTVAQGGTAPPPETFDVTDEAQRRQAMLNRLNALAG